MRCLVTGATGYIGGRLAPRLLDAGHEVRCLTRDSLRLRDVPWAARVEVVEGDVSVPATLRPAMDGIDIAYYLVHSIGHGAFEEKDRLGAANFAAAARGAGGRRPARARRICDPGPRSAGSSPAAVCRRSCCAPPLSSGPDRRPSRCCVT
jgi:uncharacterized protein YbjT (DUF2867 family)